MTRDTDPGPGSSGFRALSFYQVAACLGLPGRVLVSLDPETDWVSLKFLW